MPEELQILSEYRSIPVTYSRRNSRFHGHAFASIAMAHIKKQIPLNRYTPVLGPIWIAGLETIEWDGAILRNDLIKYSLPNYFAPCGVVAVFEFKSAGVYGLKKPQIGKKR